MRRLCIGLGSFLMAGPAHRVSDVVATRRWFLLLRQGRSRQQCKKQDKTRTNNDLSIRERTPRQFPPLSDGSLAREIRLQASRLLNYAQLRWDARYLAGFAEAIVAKSMHPTFAKAVLILAATSGRRPVHSMPAPAPKHSKPNFGPSRRGYLRRTRRLVRGPQAVSTARLDAFQNALKLEPGPPSSTTSSASRSTLPVILRKRSSLSGNQYISCPRFSSLTCFWRPRWNNCSAIKKLASNGRRLCASITFRPKRSTA